MRFCNSNTFRSSLRQWIALHSVVVFTLAFDIFIATGTFTFQHTVGLSAYPLHYREAFASDPILPPVSMRLATCS